jgi:hypothetical protein
LVVALAPSGYSSSQNQINISAGRRAARTTQRGEIGLKRRGCLVPSRLLPATVQLNAQLARQSDPMAVIDALNRRAQSRGLGGVHGDVPQAQCERNRALLVVCSGQFDSGTPT